MALTAASTPAARLKPSPVRRRRWRRRGLYLTIAVAGAAPVIYVGARIVVRMMSFMLTGGEGADPALLESGARVPDSIVRLARESGSVHANERVGLVFIPANRTFADALLLTDSAIIRRAPTGTVRRSLEESDVDLQPLKRGGSAGGLLIVKQKGTAPDTLYQDLSSREAFRFLNEVTTWRRAQKARDSTSKRARTSSGSRTRRQWSRDSAATPPERERCLDALRRAEHFGEELEEASEGGAPSHAAC
jgi:hypothetical protein